IEAFRTYDSKKALEVVQAVNTQGRSIRQFALDLLGHARNLLVVKTTQGDTSVLDYSKEYIARLKEQADGLDVHALMQYIKVFSELDSEMKVASNQRILLEVTVLKLSEAVVDEASSGLEEKLMALQAKLEKLEAREPVQVIHQAAPQKVEKEIVPTRLPEAVPEDIKALIGKWDGIKEKLGTAAKLVFKSTSPGLIEGDTFYIVHGINMEPSINSHIEEVRKFINQTMQKEVKVVPIDIRHYESKVKETHGTKMEQNDVTESISGTLRDIYSKINYKIETIN
ncbi:MAG: DNA polymerase III subunit gamma/tau, partial [Niameybacter sp.]